MKRLIPIVQWPAIRAALEQGARTFYVDHGSTWDVFIETPLAMCELLKPDYHQAHPELSDYYLIDESREFETKYLPRMPGKFG